MSGYRAEHITSDLDLVIVGNAISRGNPELEEVLDRKIRYCSLPEAIREHFLWGARSIVIAGTHGKTTTTALAGWVLTDGGRGSERARRRHRAQLRRARIQLSDGAGPRLRHRGRRVRQRVLRQDREVPQVPAGYCRRQQYRVRSRRHLCRCRVRDAGVPPPRQPRPPHAACCSSAPTASGREGWPAAPSRASRRSARPKALDWQAHDLESMGASTRFKVRRGGAPYGTFEVPLVGAHNVRNATAAIAIAADVGIARRADRRRAAPVRRREAAARSRAARPRRDGVRRLRAPSDGGRRNAGRAPGGESGRHASGRCSSRDRRRRAAASFRTTSPARSGRRTKSSSRRCSDRRCRKRSGCPFRSWFAISSGRGQSAREADSLDDIIATIVREHRPGDLVVLMSNGGFGGIHQKLLRALGREARSVTAVASWRPATPR